MTFFAETLANLLGDQYRVTSSQMAQLEHHFELLVRWSRRLNLTAIQSLHEIIERHYCESIALAHVLPLEKQQILDAGTGAGFPGVPIAIVKPQHFVYLVDSDGKKTVFLRESTLGLQNCLVVRSRVEEVRHQATWLVSRAVHFRDLLPYAAGAVDHIGLLVTEEGVVVITQEPDWDWQPAIRLPWGRQRCILIGNRRLDSH